LSEQLRDTVALVTALRQERDKVLEVSHDLKVQLINSEKKAAQSDKNQENISN